LVSTSPAGIEHETISVDIADWLIERLSKRFRVKPAQALMPLLLPG